MNDFGDTNLVKLNTEGIKSNMIFTVAKVLGITIRENTSIKSNLFCLDELDLESGDWIDIGEPLKTGDVFPVTVKSLVFNKNKEK